MNKSYSLRSFARQLNIPAGRLSEILSGKRALNQRLANKIADQAFEDASTRKSFLESVERSSKKNEKVKNKSIEFKSIEDDEFSFIASWEHFAILTLIETDLQNLSNETIAQHLGLSKVEVNAAIGRLMRLGYLAKDKKEAKYIRTTPPLKTPTDAPSAALRKSHRQTLEQAIVALEEIDIELRDITSISIPTNPRKLKTAKKLITEFRRKLYQHLSSGLRTSVYNLNIQLVPVLKE